MIQGINHITWNVLDIDQAFHFYTDLLGIQPIMKSNKSAYFLVGSCWCAIVLGECKTENSYNHLAFDVLPTTIEPTSKNLGSTNVIDGMIGSLSSKDSYTACSLYASLRPRDNSLSSILVP